MEVARRLWQHIVRAWLTFANVVGGFLEEAAFRLELAFDVLIGRAPLKTYKRPWYRSMEAPTLIDCYDWTTDRFLFSVLVWPSLETPAYSGSRYQQDRAEEVKEAIAKGAADRAWCTRFETDYGLQWDHRRECWVDSSGFAYDGSRFGRPGDSQEGEEAAIKQAKKE